jgi:hypothetical protein
MPKRDMAVASPLLKKRHHEGHEEHEEGKREIEDIH